MPSVLSKQEPAGQRGLGRKPGTEGQTGGQRWQHRGNNASDGPGGYADPAGRNADTQQEGEN